MSQIKKIILTGVFWSSLTQIFTQIFTILSSAVLARLLSPSDYGIMAMVALATGFLSILKDFGLGAALVQKKEVDDDEYCTVFWLNVMIGVVACILVFVLAGPIANFFKEPLVAVACRAVSFSFILNSFGIVWNNLLQKQVEFKQMFYRGIFSIIAGAIVGIICAYFKMGFWALILQSYTALIVGTYLNFLRVKWRPRFVFRKDKLRGLLRFGMPLLADQTTNYWMRNLDNLLVGKFLGKIELAYYNRAYNLMLLPVRQLSGTLTRVLFPSLSLIQEDIKKIQSIYLRVSRSIALVAFPLMIFLSILADLVIVILYGKQWTNVIPIFRILSLLGMFQAIATLSGNIYLSQGKTRLLFKIGLFSRTVLISGIVIGLFTKGLMGMVYGYCIASAIAFLPELYFTGRIIGLKLVDLVKNFLPYLLASAFAGLIIGIIHHNFSINKGVDLLGLITIGLGIYIAICYFFKLNAFVEVSQMAMSFINRKKKNKA